MGIFEKLKSKDFRREKETITESPDPVSGIPFPAYKGNEPYIFISYSHRDSAEVYPIISVFNNENYKVWYDEGIEPGIEWPEEIAKALDGCALFLVFVSPSAVGSPNVRNEINYALTRKLPFIAIHLKETELTPGLQLQMGSKQAIFKYNMEEESFKRKYTYSFETVLQVSRRKVTPPKKPVSGGPAPVSMPVTALEPSVPFAQEVKTHVHNSAQADISNECEWIGSKLVRYHGGEKEVTIPFRASVLYSNAFKDNQMIERISIPSSVSSIDFDAFTNCPNLHRVVIEGKYVKIGDGNLPVSSRCDKLTFQCHRNSLTQKELLKAFAGPVVYFPGEEFEIEHGVLHKYIGNAKEVQLPAEVQIIGGFSFDKCLNLESLVLNDECGAILDNAFIYCPQLKNITLGKSFSSLAEGALRHIPYVRFSYYKHRMPEKLDQLFPDMSILSEIHEAYKVTA